jgi:glycosyltransferase involved in cell wall biosynthesis
MKLAYFSPMPPARTGVATYSSELLPALAKHFDITVFTPTALADVPAQVRAVNFVADPGVLKTIATFDRALYHLGNNPYFHLDILRAFLLRPDAVVLHDTVLYFLAAGGGRGALLQELIDSNPAKTFDAMHEIDRHSPDGDVLRYPTPSKYPCLTRVLRNARQVIVHNQAARHEVETRDFRGAINVVPLLHYGGVGDQDIASDEKIRSFRSKYALEPDSVVFGAFGFIGPTKRLDKVLKAVSLVTANGRLPNIRLLVVGEGVSINEFIRDGGLDKIVIQKGFVDDDDFGQLLASVDIVVNLRYPSHGESSATLIQAMLRRKPCVVTNDASFVDFPDTTVVKVGFGTREVEEIADAMVRLAESRTLRREIGEAARSHVLAHHAPERVAAEYQHALAQLPSAWEGSEATPQSCDVRPYVAQYWDARVKSLIP